MKTWWLETGLPWLKSNWWVLLILPLIALVWVASRFYRRPPPFSDVTAPADERAEIEAMVRARQLSIENKQLTRRIEELGLELKGKEEELEKRVEAEVEKLREDPEALRDYMLRHGPGNR
jgi:hypothetical protein